MIVYGAQLFTFRNAIKSFDDLRRVFGSVREEGGGSVQLSGLKIKVDFKELRTLAADNGLVIPLTHTPWKRITEDTDNVIREHRDLGAETVGLGMMPAAFRSKEGLKTFIDSVNAVRKELSAEGMEFAYHNHAFEFKKIGGERIIDVLARECPEISFIFDTYWCYFAGYDPVEEMKKLGGRLKNIHFKDGYRFLGLPLITAVGSGKLDFKKITECAAEAGTRYAYIEHDFARDPYAVTRKSLRFLFGLEKD